MVLKAQDQISSNSCTGMLFDGSGDLFLRDPYHTILTVLLPEFYIQNHSLAIYSQKYKINKKFKKTP